MNAARLRGNPWAVLGVASLGYFMTLLDLTIVNIAIPDMIARLHASLSDALWVLNAYALVLAVLVITCGRLGDLLGLRTMFTAGIAVFTAASAACGLAPGPGWLIGFRAVQGLGAAMLMPQTLAMITMVFPSERRGSAFGVWGAVTGIATVAGPAFGGLLVTAADWRWIFFINLPVGAAVLAATPAVIPDLRSGLRHRLDLRGVTLVSLALLAICYGLIEGQPYRWGTVTGFVSIPLIIGVGLALLLVFVADQMLRRNGESEPLMPSELFRDRNFSLMNVVAATLAIGVLGVFLGFTIYLQDVLRYSALKAGLTLLPSSLVSIAAAPAAGKLTDRIGGKYILVAGLALFPVGIGWAVLAAGPDSAWYDFLPALVCTGLGIGLVFAPLTAIAMSQVPQRLAGAASGVLGTTRQIGSVIGTAAVGALLQNRLAAALTDHGYVDALRWTMLLPIAIVALATVSALAIR
jgi:EmrB/QacA subfamily drug resistance transporter